MRILHLDRQRHWAGQQARTLSLALRQREAGDEVLIVCSPGSGYERRAPAVGIPTLVIRMRGSRLFGAMLHLARFLRRERYDVIDAHGAVDHQLAIFATIFSLSAAVVRTKHNLSRLRGFMSRFSYGRLTARLIAVSGAVRESLVQDGIPGERIETVFDGIDTGAVARSAKMGDRAAARARFDLPADAFVVGTTSRPSPRKGLEIACRAVAEVARLQPERRIVYIAAGGAPDEMRALATGNGLDAAHFRAPGLLANVCELFPALDAFLFPSHEEALGMALLEALAAALPVAASAVGGIAEVVEDGRSGLLLPPGDAPALARAIEKLRDDPALGRRLGEAGQLRVQERYDLRCMVEGTRRAYERALGPR